MTMDDLVKYIIWIVFFGVVLAGMYFTLKQIGIIS